MGSELDLHGEPMGLCDGQQCEVGVYGTANGADPPVLVFLEGIEVMIPAGMVDLGMEIGETAAGEPLPGEPG